MEGALSVTVTINLNNGAVLSDITITLTTEDDTAVCKSVRYHYFWPF